MNERFPGPGAEWRDSNLTPGEAKIATSWVELKIDRRSMLTGKDRVEDVRDAMWQLEKDGEIVVHRLAAGVLRNFHQAYVSARAQGLPDAYFFPLVHCGTSFGNYKEVRAYLIRSAKLRERMRTILGKLGRLVDGKILIPEEVVHYSEWGHVLREKIAGLQGS